MNRRRWLALAPALLPGLPPAQAGPAAATVGGPHGPLLELLSQVAGDGSNTHGVVVRQSGRLLAEAYYTALDKPGGAWFSREVAFTADTLHDLRSISKSVVALLVGVAIGRGLIGDLDRPVFDHFPEHADLLTPERRALTVQHLLDMVTGWRWDESRYSYADPRNSETRMSIALDPVRHLLELPLVARPGTVWEYCGGATLMLAEILERQARAPLATLARDWLFEPLGIGSFEWRTGLFGRTLSFSGLRLTPRDLATVGELMLARGRHAGRSIVPADWIDTIRRPRYRGWDRHRYAAQWWHSREEDAPAWLGGWGNGGQRLLVVPERELVVAVTAGRYNQPQSGRASMQLYGRILDLLPSA